MYDTCCSGWRCAVRWWRLAVVARCCGHSAQREVATQTTSTGRGTWSWTSSLTSVWSLTETITVFYSWTHSCAPPALSSTVPNHRPDRPGSLSPDANCSLRTPTPSTFLYWIPNDARVVWCQYGLQESKNRPDPFPGRMSRKATKPGAVLCFILVFFCLCFVFFTGATMIVFWVSVVRVRLLVMQVIDCNDSPAKWPTKC